MDTLAAYRRAAITHGEASADGDARRANRAFKELTRIRDELRRAGPEHARSILGLLDDDNVFVRKAAAVDALELSPEDGVRVLQAIAEGPESLHQLSAEILLKQWADGEFAR